MKYQIDHDYHIHSRVSSCSNDPRQTPERLLQYAESCGLKRICLTDHYWDDRVPGPSNWYAPQNRAHLFSSLPLPQKEGIRFLFGCETEMDQHLNIGISDEGVAELNFVIIPTTHLHMTDFTVPASATPADRAKAYVERFDAIFTHNWNFRKMGIAHLVSTLIDEKGGADNVLKMIPDETFVRLFTKAAQAGIGIEINSGDFGYAKERFAQTLHIFGIAKEAGCKFYLGSDAHHPNELESAIPIFENAVNELGLTEDDKFHISC